MISNNTGIAARYCPHCGKVIWRDAEINIKDGKDRIEFKTICPHCHNLIKIVVGAEIFIYKYKE